MMVVKMGRKKATSLRRNLSLGAAFSRNGQICWLISAHSVRAEVICEVDLVSWSARTWKWSQEKSVQTQKTMAIRIIKHPIETIALNVCI